MKSNNNENDRKPSKSKFKQESTKDRRCYGSGNCIFNRLYRIVHRK